MCFLRIAKFFFYLLSYKIFICLLTASFTLHIDTKISANQGINVHCKTDSNFYYLNIFMNNNKISVLLMFT